TAHIKQQMAEQTLREKDARAAASAGEAAIVRRSREAEATAAAARRVIVEQAHTRSGKAAALQRLRERRVSEFCSEDDGMHAEEEGDGADVEQGEEEEKSEEVCGEDEGVVAAESKGDGGVSSPRQGQKRSVEEVDEDMLVTVPPFQQQQHKTWAAFGQGLKQYMTETHQVLVVKEVINVARRNATLKKQIQYQGVPEEEIPLIPSAMEPTSTIWLLDYEARVPSCPMTMPLPRRSSTSIWSPR
ncbi:hypothetical protein PF002_g31104, partial [Phytophthora fragariae]